MNLNKINKMYETLEFNKVIQLLENQALSEKARHRIRQLIPYLSETEIHRHMNETTQAKLILEQYGNPPLSPMNDLEKALSSLGKGIFLLPEQLTGIAQFLAACRRLKSYLRRSESTSAEVALYGNSIFELSDIEDEINRAVRGNVLDDKASVQLASIRRKLISSNDQVKSRLESLLRNNPNWFSESFVSVRNGHCTLPVKREYKNNVAGTVIDVSQSGGTCFIEPTVAAKLQQEISLLHMEEENEIRRILFALTALVEENLPAIKINVEAMETLDFIFAKAKLSIVMKAEPLPVRMERKIVIKGGRHPLLNAENIVPLDFEMGGDIKGIVITGPNTGGKTVALKTIGLLSMMAQSGLHVPATGGVFTMNNAVLCDIGDGQSITENLSTFSSHITNIIDILRMADVQSLVLLDELGSGTDPAEGMGLAVSILEELRGKNCLFVATTHYPEIKDFAKSTPGLINARMAFDRKTLQPLYRLETGEAGESCALYIARRLGMPLHMIERAAKAAYGSDSRNKDTIDSGSGSIGSDSIGNDSISSGSIGSDGDSITSSSGSIGSSGAQSTGYDCAEMSEGRKTTDVMIPQIDNIVPVQSSCHNSEVLQSVKPQAVKKVLENPPDERFNIGDSVIVYPQKLIGIVYQKANVKGDVGVQVQKAKLLVNHKRLKLQVAAEELYPDNYDFSVVFDSVADRKKRKQMAKKHNPDLLFETTSGEGGKTWR